MLFAPCGHRHDCRCGTPGGARHKRQGIGGKLRDSPRQFRKGVGPSGSPKLTHGAGPLFHGPKHGLDLYIRMVCPALGGHSFSGSFLCLVRTASWLKLLRDTYSPRKRSITLENKNTPPPANMSSSSSSSTRVPRAKVMPFSETRRAKWRALVMLVMPSICFSE